MKNRGERVRELQDTQRRDEGGKAEEVRDRGRDDESDGPVDGDDDRPEHLAFLAVHGRGGEPFHEDVVVEDFDADVAVEAGGDQGGDDGEDVARGLPVVGGDALVGWVDGVLALVCGESQ